MVSANVAAEDVAKEPATDDSGRWKYTAEGYLWGATIDGKSASGSDFEIDFSEIFDDLDFAFMGNLTAQRDKWTLLSDLIYLNISDSGKNAAKVSLGPQDVPIEVDANVKLKAWIVNALAGYNLVENEANRLDLMGGVRYLHLKTDVKLDVENIPGVDDKVSDSGSNWDGVVGVRGRLNLNEKCYVPYYADVGTGDSDLTWQVLAGVGYRFKRVDVVATYRYLKWKWDNNDVFDNLVVKGPMLGVKYAF